MRRLVAAAVALGALWIAPSAEATIHDVFGGAVTCSLQADNDRMCGNSSPRSTVPTFDAVPIDVNVAFPADDGVGPDGNYPLIMCSTATAAARSASAAWSASWTAATRSSA